MSKTILDLQIQIHLNLQVNRIGAGEMAQLDSTPCIKMNPEVWIAT